MDWDAFYQLHEGLPREGPGTAADVDWALDLSGLGGAIAVCDAGCGPGADLETLADRLPEARLTGIDMHEGFAAAAQKRCVRFGTRVAARPGDMAKLEGGYDLIWCAGALYFLGVTEGLRIWRDALAPDGLVAFSEPVLVPGPVPEPARAFWKDYPAITDLSGIKARVSAAGYQTLGHRTIVGEAWEAYYRPMRARIAELRAGSPGPALAEILDLHEREADLWAAAPDHVAYALLLVRPV